MIKLDFDASQIASLLLMEIRIYLGVNENGRYFPQIGEVMAEKFLRFILHDNKDVSGSDGFRIINGEKELQSVKSIGKSGFTLQVSSLTGLR